MMNEEAAKIILSMIERGENNVHDVLFDVLTILEINALKRAYCALERDRWISVEERLPPLFDETYLVCLAWGGVGTMVFKATGFHNYGSFSPVPIETVTHWMPLPEPPKEET